jgi:hypothetical protein
MWVTERVGRNTYVSTGVFFCLLSLTFLVAIGATILFYGLIGIGAILLVKGMVRRWPWTSYLGLNGSSAPSSRSTRA